MFCGFRGSGFGFSSGMYMMMGIKILVFIALIVIGVKLIKNYTENSNSALKILDEKFAKGEISEEEYIKKRAVMANRK